MIAPLKWIRDYVTIDIAPEEFADRMIMIGNGVEGIEAGRQHEESCRGQNRKN